MDDHTAAGAPRVKSASTPKSKSKAKPNANPSRPPEPIARRLATFRQRMASWKVDALLVSDRMDGYYLTGFSGESGHVLITQEEVVLLTDGRFDEQADREAPWATKVLRGKSFGPVIAAQCHRLEIHVLGFFPTTVTVADAAKMQAELKDADVLKAAGGAKPVKLKATKGSLAPQRRCKDEDEVELIRASISVAEAAFMSTWTLLKPGMTELCVNAELIYRIHNGGAEDPSFSPIIASGPNAALAHYRPKAVPVDFKVGLLIDWGAQKSFYCSDLTRVLLPAKCPQPWPDLVKACCEAQQAAIAAIKPGVSLKAPDDAARKVLKKAKLEKYFTHGLGHGIGLNIHEAPRMNQYVGDDKDEDFLVPGMVVTVEPGIYLPGEAGVRIEDDVLVTEDGCEVLTGVPYDLRLG